MMNASSKLSHSLKYASGANVIKPFLDHCVLIQFYNFFLTCAYVKEDWGLRSWKFYQILAPIQTQGAPIATFSHKANEWKERSIEWNFHCYDRHDNE